jgi:hypothetical protein
MSTPTHQQLVDWLDTKISNSADAVMVVSILRALTRPDDQPVGEEEREALEWAARQAEYRAENRLMTDDFNGEAQFKRTAALLRRLANRGRP